eukprot:1161710-Pelagomonas_calceolata.AAC.5
MAAQSDHHRHNTAASPIHIFASCSHLIRAVTWWLSAMAIDSSIIHNVVDSSPLQLLAASSHSSDAQSFHVPHLSGLVHSFACQSQNTTPYRMYLE